MEIWIYQYEEDGINDIARLTQSAILDEFESANYRRELYDVGTFEIVLANSSKAELLQRDNFVLFDNDYEKIGIITKRRYSEDENGAKWTISGVESKGILARVS